MDFDPNDPNIGRELTQQECYQLGFKAGLERAAEYVGRNLMSCGEYAEAIRALKEK